MVDSVSEYAQGVTWMHAIEPGARRPDVVEGHGIGAAQKVSTA